MSRSSYRNLRDRLLMTHRNGNCKKFGNDDCPWCVIEEVEKNGRLPMDTKYPQTFQTSTEQANERPHSKTA